MEKSTPWLLASSLSSVKKRAVILGASSAQLPAQGFHEAVIGRVVVGVGKDKQFHRLLHAVEEFGQLRQIVFRDKPLGRVFGLGVLGCFFFFVSFPKRAMSPLLGSLFVGLAPLCSPSRAVRQTIAGQGAGFSCGPHKKEEYNGVQGTRESGPGGPGYDTGDEAMKDGLVAAALVFFAAIMLIFPFAWERVSESRGPTSV